MVLYLHPGGAMTDMNPDIPAFVPVTLPCPHQTHAFSDAMSISSTYYRPRKFSQSFFFNFKINLCYWVIIIQLFKLTIEHLHIGPFSIGPPYPIPNLATQLLQQAVVLCAFDIASIRHFVLLNVCCADRISTLDWKLKIFSTFIIYGSRITPVYLRN